MTPGTLLVGFGSDRCQDEMPTAPSTTRASPTPRPRQRLAPADACQLLFLVTLEPTQTICLVFY